MSNNTLPFLRMLTCVISSMAVMAVAVTLLGLDESQLITVVCPPASNGSLQFVISVELLLFATCPCLQENCKEVGYELEILCLQTHLQQLHVIDSMPLQPAQAGHPWTARIPR